MTQEELMHFGVKGQKWGVRRYQNKDGSLTAAGKKHQKVDQESSEKKGLSTNQKRAIKVGVAVAGTALATYGVYKLNKYIKSESTKIHIENGESFAKKVGDMAWKESWNASDNKKDFNSVSLINKLRNTGKVDNREAWDIANSAKIGYKFHEDATSGTRAEEASRWASRTAKKNYLQTRGVDPETLKSTEKFRDAAKNVYDYKKNRKNYRKPNVSYNGKVATINSWS